IDGMTREDRDQAGRAIAGAGAWQPVSARTGEGVEAMLARVDTLLPGEAMTRVVLRLPAGDGATLHLLHEHGRVIGTRYTRQWCVVEAEVPESVKPRLRKFMVRT
ncbi:MAG: hypothetical protein ACRD44_08930, partial [Bryobacteraceae bacterium]